MILPFLPDIPMHRLTTLALALALGILTNGLRAESDKPNIIFILVDDQGYYHVGC